MKMVNLVIFLVAMAIFSKNNATELNLTFQQADYQVYFERIELINYNKRYIKEMHVKTFKYNRTLAVVNGSFITSMDLGNEIEAVVDVYKFLSNEYRFFGVHFQANACKGFAANAGGLKTAAARCGNIIGCPFRKGIRYYTCNSYPDQSQLPPYVPTGQYRIDIQIIVDPSQEVVGAGSVYATVSRPFVFKF